MNALANSQEGELTKFLCRGYPDNKGPITFKRYTGQENPEEKLKTIENPPDILLTNYVMLELLLTRPDEKPLINSAINLQYLVFDELHTYRGRQGSDVAMLIRRCREIFSKGKIQCVGTSATLAGAGLFSEQQKEVARIGSLIFGDVVKPDNIIGETLCRATPEIDIHSIDFKNKLKSSLLNQEKVHSTYEEYLNNPLSQWIESTFGIEKDNDTGRYSRVIPQSIYGENGAAKSLSKLTGIPEKEAGQAIENHLLASYKNAINPQNGFPLFAFRLHQFISRGDTVYSTIETEDTRYITVHGQRFAPIKDKEKLLFPLCFCRECGQEYYIVRKKTESGGVIYEGRELSDRQSEESNEAGFLYINNKEPWPDGGELLLDRIPDEWLEEYKGNLRIKRDREKYLPQIEYINENGNKDQDGTKCHFIPTPFRFCLSCGVSYNFRQSADYGKLALLATEGRSTATTVLTLAAIRFLKDEKTLPDRAKKLLSFTDNRQDASLQSGHFNDFIEIGLLRSAIYKAASSAGNAGISHDSIAIEVFNSLDLPLDLYAVDPLVRFQALDETKKALREVLGYRLYRDLKRGWRVTAPNLEQCGLLEIEYKSLEDICKAEDIWQGTHTALEKATPENRKEVSKALLDYMRRELAIKVNYLDQQYQESIRQNSSQRLKEPWGIDENETMEWSTILIPRPKIRGQDHPGYIYLSPRGGFGQYLNRRGTFPHVNKKMKSEDIITLFINLLNALQIGGLVEQVLKPENDNDFGGYQIPASGILWKAGDGTKPFRDVIHVPRASVKGGNINKFFSDFYKLTGKKETGIEAREHTAQVDYDKRIERETKFREGTLPILFCSPTMELGVDISELNVVNMRNVPPTPANYAQRSGRAGRSGQPALVFTYCHSYRPHDQYFFKRPNLMVAGAVTPPRIDLTNEELIRSHVHAIWLGETGLALGASLIDILEVGGTNPTLVLSERVRDIIKNGKYKENAKIKTLSILSKIRSDLESTKWFTDHWIDEVFNQLEISFDHACNRWRDLYRAALRQQRIQDKIITDATSSADDKKRAKRLRSEAESQMELLTQSQRLMEADFYSYRYFASEGFLPGYNFPRLPLSAYIPGRRKKDEYISRPRFLAISEFGPRAIVYHEGSRYRINKVILPVEARSEDLNITTTSVKICPACAFLHPIKEAPGPDKCEQCGNDLGSEMNNLLRLQNVSTKRTDKINSDEEERLRLGYDLITGIRFASYRNEPVVSTANIVSDNNNMAILNYGHASTIWRINLGWKRRAEKSLYGFMLDIERGFWA
ncbi:MAG: hypothetical protein A2096_11770, partial [Spirochaetes bacterium GWF1_41_5]